MKKITSKENPKIKQLKHLQKKKKRNEYGLFVIENLATIYDAFRSGFSFKTLFVAEYLMDDDRVKYLLKNTKEYYFIDAKVDKYVSSLSTSSGIYAVYDVFEDKIDFSNDIVYLNAIGDPGNLGTIIRTAVAFDIKNIVVDKKCADIYNSKTISASKDAIFKVNILHDNDFKALDEIKKEMKIYLTDVRDGAGIEVLKNDDKKCIVLGNESHGVDDVLEEYADEFINIKINKKIESLNVAISAGIIFQQRLN